MPKRLKTQRRGAGSPIYAATKHGAGEAKYTNYEFNSPLLRGEIVEVLNDPARTGVLTRIKYDNGAEETTIAAEGIYVGQRIEQGKNAALEIGNIKTLGSCTEGCPVFNIEKFAGDGGSLIRSSGMYGLIMTKDKTSVY